MKRQRKNRKRARPSALTESKQLTAWRAYNVFFFFLWGWDIYLPTPFIFLFFIFQPNTPPENETAARTCWAGTKRQLWSPNRKANHYYNPVSPACFLIFLFLNPFNFLEYTYPSFHSNSNCNSNGLCPNSYPHENLLLPVNRSPPLFNTGKYLFQLTHLSSNKRINILF